MIIHLVYNFNNKSWKNNTKFGGGVLNAMGSINRSIAMAFGIHEDKWNKINYKINLIKQMIHFVDILSLEMV